MVRLTLVALVGWWASAANVAAVAQEDANRQIKIKPIKSGVEIFVGDELFTRFLASRDTKPTFFPVNAPGQIPMTRSYPLAEAPGEAKDHPHHQSIWLGHEVNGLDFWANRDGIIKFHEFGEIDQENRSFQVSTQWIKRDGNEVICTVDCKYTFGADENSRWIDSEFSFRATHGDVEFEDTKEGMFAIRTHPSLRLKAAKEFPDATTGNAINSEGVKGKLIWGKPAKWVNYWGVVDGKEVGVGIFDHPDNFRHPTCWHAREYGLVAANPFGLHHFTGAAKGTGSHTIPKGESMTFRYRMAFHQGGHDPDVINQQFESFSNQEEK